VKSETVHLRVLCGSQNKQRLFNKEFLCITHSVEHNYISPVSTVGIQLHVSALYQIISLYNINWLVFITDTECLLRGTDWILKNQLVWFSSFKAYVSNWRVKCCLWDALLIRAYKIATERLVCGCKTWFVSPCKVTSHRRRFLKDVVLRGGLETERKEAVGGWRENCIMRGYVMLLLAEH